MSSVPLEIALDRVQREVANCVRKAKILTNVFDVPTDMAIDKELREISKYALELCTN